MHVVQSTEKHSTKAEGLYCYICHRYWGRACTLTIERANGFVVAKEPMALCDDCIKDRHRVLAAAKR